MTAVMLGKARVQIEVKGCLDCGTEHSSGWHHSKSIVVTVAKRTLGFDVYRCAECQAKTPQAKQLEIP